jgi:hypothetical protein
MFCSNCGAKIEDPNQKFCASCGTEILTHPKTDTYRIETPQYESPPGKLQKGPPGKNSKLCLVFAISSLVLAFVPIYTLMIFQYNLFIGLSLNVVGLVLGVLSKIYGSKAGKSEPFNNLEKAGSIIVIPAFIFGAIALMMLVLGFLDVRI